MRKTQKTTAVVGGTIAAVLVGGIAFAYWTASGSGTGSASTSAGTSNLTVEQTSVITDMYPGDEPQAIEGTVTNNADNSAYVTQVVVSIESVDKADGAAAGDCDASDYTLSDATMLVGVDVASGDVQAFSGATIQFNNKLTNQDPCKGATVNLAYAAS